MPPQLQTSAVVQVRAGRMRASGYLIRPGVVLTAAHGIPPSDAPVTVCGFPASGRWEVEATVAVRLDEADLAVLTFPAAQGPDVVPTGFGALDASTAAEVPCQAVGFPQFMLRETEVGPSFRDSHALHGMLEIGSGLRSGIVTLAMTVPPDRPADGASPWAGMSGAAVMVGGYVVGFVAEHHHRQGLGRLTVSLATSWIDRLPAATLAEVHELLGLPTAASGLARAVPDADERAEMQQRAYVSGSGYAAAGFNGREEELAAMNRFVTEDTGRSVQWWWAPPYAGKTSLAAEFALHPPATVRVIAYFVSARIGGQNTRDEFTAEIVRQLCAIAGEPDERLDAGERIRRLASLCRLAAAALARYRRTLVLLVDGLDEDANTDESSIAALLRLLPLDEMHLIITSRLQPRVPVAIEPERIERRELSAWPGATRDRQLAEDEIRAALRNDLWCDLLAFISLTGGLPLPDLADLLETGQVKLLSILHNRLTRTFETITYGVQEPTWVFAHTALQEAAAELLESEMQGYRDRVHRWFVRHQTAGWGPDAPEFLLHRYPAQLLAGGGDAVTAIERSGSAVVDSLRHERMRARTGADGAAVQEMQTWWDRAARERRRDLLATMLRCRIEQRRLSGRNAYISVRVPGVWARLGRDEYAINLARSLSRPDAALCSVVGPLWKRSPELAEQLAAEIRTARWRGLAFARLSLAAAPADAVRALDLLKLAGQARAEVRRADAARTAGMLTRTLNPRDELDELIEEAVAAVRDGGSDAAEAADARWAGDTVLQMSPVRDLTGRSSARLQLREVGMGGLRVGRRWAALGRAAARVSATDPLRLEMALTRAEKEIVELESRESRLFALLQIASARMLSHPERAEALFAIAARLQLDMADMDAFDGRDHGVNLVSSLMSGKVSDWSLSPEDRAEGVAVYLENLAATDPRRAERLLLDVEQRSRDRASLRWGENAVAKLVVLLADRDIARAEQMLPLIETTWIRVRCAAELAATVRERSPEAAVRILDSAMRLVREHRASAAPIDLVPAYAQLGRALALLSSAGATLLAEAERQADEMPDDYRKATAYQEVVRCWGSVDPDRADRVLRKLRAVSVGEAHYPNALATLASVIAPSDTAGSTRYLAELAAIRITNLNRKDVLKALARGACALAGISSLTAAPFLAEARVRLETTTADVDPELLYAIALSLTPVDPGGAERLVERAARLRRQNPNASKEPGPALLIALAEARADRNPARAVADIVTVLGSDGWDLAIPAVARLNPGEMADVATAVEQALRPHETAA